MSLPESVLIEDPLAPDEVLLGESSSGTVVVGGDDLGLPPVVVLEPEIDVDYLGVDMVVVKGDPGMSAYELAVLGGFVGTEAQWLESLQADVVDHVNDPTPHPAYDDMPDLTLLFNNGLV